jgi:hypothetical protein
VIGLDQNCPRRASLGTKKFDLQDLGLKRPNRASCGTKCVFSSFFAKYKKSSPAELGENIQSGKEIKNKS